MSKLYNYPKIALIILLSLSAIYDDLMIYGLLNYFQITMIWLTIQGVVTIWIFGQAIKHAAIKE